jgi:hypothetical protein
MKTRAKTYKDLDKIRCGNPSCTKDHTVIFLHCELHPTAPLSVCYNKEFKELAVLCDECEDAIVCLFIAPGEFKQVDYNSAAEGGIESSLDSF